MVERTVGPGMATLGIPQFAMEETIGDKGLSSYILARRLFGCAVQPLDGGCMRHRISYKRV